MRTLSALLLTFLGFFECHSLAAQTPRTPLDEARNSILRGARQSELKAACTHRTGTCGGSYSTTFACFSSTLHVFGDFYDTTLSAGQSLTATASSTDIVVAIFDPSGNPVSTSNAGTTESTSYTATVAGVYTVFVFSDIETGYTLTLACATTTPPVCTPDPETLCMNNGRFSVSADWTKTDGTSGHGTAVVLTDDTGYFWFFDSTNTEMVVKVLNGCAINSAYWVFAAGLTNVQVNWEVLDTKTGAAYPQVNSQGTPFAPIQATNAFPSSCP
jgi:hypothetical protein